jgi:hypothetical protein
MNSRLLTTSDEPVMRSVPPFRLTAPVPSLWGFFADRAQNRMGDTGWDFMKGELSVGRHTRTPNEFQAKVIAWLNTFYPERAAFHGEEG